MFKTITNITEYTWQKSMAEFFMYPFIPLFDVLIKDTPFCKDTNKVLTFEASVLFESYQRTSIPSSFNIVDDTYYISYKWVNPLSKPDGTTVIEGGPINQIYSFSNTAANNTIKRFNFTTGLSEVTYKKCNTERQSPKTVCAQYPVINDSMVNFGNNRLYNACAASSASLSVSNTPFALEYMVGKIVESSLSSSLKKLLAISGMTPSDLFSPLVFRVANSVFFNKSMMYSVPDAKFINNKVDNNDLSAGTSTDNGIFIESSPSNPTLNIGDGVPFANNTGILPIIKQSKPVKLTKTRHMRSFTLPINKDRKMERNPL